MSEEKFIHERDERRLMQVLSEDKSIVPKRVEFQLAFQGSAEIFADRLLRGRYPVEIVDAASPGAAAAAAPDLGGESLLKAMALFSIHNPEPLEELITRVGGIVELSKICDDTGRNVFHHIAALKIEDADPLLETLLNIAKTDQDKSALSEALVQCDMLKFQTPYSEFVALAEKNPKWMKVLKTLTENIISNSSINQGDFRNNVTPLCLVAAQFAKNPNLDYLDLIAKMIERGANPNVRGISAHSKSAVEIIHRACKEAKSARLSPENIKILKSAEALILLQSLYKSVLLSDRPLTAEAQEQIETTRSIEQKLSEKLCFGYDAQSHTPYFRYSNDTGKTFEISIAAGEVKLFEVVTTREGVELIDQRLNQDQAIAQISAIAMMAKDAGRDVKGGGLDISTISSEEERLRASSVGAAAAKRVGLLSRLKSAIRPGGSTPSLPTTDEAAAAASSGAESPSPTAVRAARSATFSAALGGGPRRG